MKCLVCGKENIEGALFCSGCGNRLQDTAPAPVPTPVYVQPITEETLPAQFKPIGMWGYLGYELLFAIPCIGFILLLVFSFGGNKNKNVQNFARSYFCLFIIGAILSIVIIALMGGTAALAGLLNY